jgi:predicted permease
MGAGREPGRFREALYRLLLLSYPPSFRRRYGEDLMDTFREMWSAEARGRPLRETRLWLRLIRDGITGGWYTRLTRTRAPQGPFGMEEAVGIRAVVSGVRSDARQAVRALRRTPGFTAVVVATLALGIGATTAVFSVLHEALLRPLPYADPGRLVRLYMTQEDDPGAREYVTGTHYLAYRDRMSSFRSLAAVYTYAETGADVMVGDRPERVRLLHVAPEYFGVLAQEPARGRGFYREEARSGATLAVLSARFSRRTFGGSVDVIGEKLTLSGQPYTVVGVMHGAFEDPLVGVVDVWIPQDLEVTDSTNQPYNHYLSVIGRLAPDVTLERARSELAAVSQQLAEEYPEQEEWRATIVPLHEDLVGSARALLYVLFGAVGVVLLIVCVNVANLFLVQSLGRRREFAVRAALGSGGLRLGRQLLTESLALSLIGGLLGIGVAWLGVEALIALGADAIPRLDGVRFDRRVLGFALAVTVLTGIAFGLAPALRFARSNITAELAERSSTGGRRLGRLRGGLVVTQVALSLVLLSGAGVLVASFQRLRDIELGFRPDGALTFEVHLPDLSYDPAARARLHDEMVRRLEALPGVMAAGAISRLPATGRFYSWGTRPETGPLAGQQDAIIGGDQRVIEGRVFDALGIGLIRGRFFDERDGVDAPRRYVINEYAADRLFPGIDPIGQQVRPAMFPGEVVGVAGNAVSSVEGQVRATIYHHHAQFASNRNWALTYVIRTDGEPLALIPTVRRTLAGLDSELVLYRPHLLEQVIDDALGQRRFALALMLAFAGVALALAALGLYAVLAFAVAQRRREIGVRMALGATAGRIRRLVLSRALVLASFGAGIGLGASLVVSRWLEALVFEVRVNDARVLAAVTLIVFAVAAVAGFIPAARAARIDPRTVIEEA